MREAVGENGVTLSTVALATGWFAGTSKVLFFRIGVLVFQPMIPSFDFDEHRLNCYFARCVIHCSSGRYSRDPYSQTSLHALQRMHLEMSFAGVGSPGIKAFAGQMSTQAVHPLGW